MVLHRVTLYCMVLHGETGKLGQSDKERTKKSFYLGYFPKPMTPPLTPLDTFRKNFVIFYQKVVFLGKKHILACLGAPPLFREIPIKKRFFKSLPQSGGGQVVPSCFHLCPVSATRCVE